MNQKRDVKTEDETIEKKNVKEKKREQKDKYEYEIQEVKTQKRSAKEKKSVKEKKREQEKTKDGCGVF
jgi:hypothetical protein